MSVIVRGGGICTRMFDKLFPLPIPPTTSLYYFTPDLLPPPLLLIPFPHQMKYRIGNINITKITKPFF